MDAAQEQFDRIERYLLGQMSADEANAFERQLETDPAFAEEVALQRLEHDAMEVLIEQDIRKQMAGWAAQAAPKETPIRRIRRLRPWLVAAVVVISLPIALYLLFPATVQPIAEVDPPASQDSTVINQEPIANNNQPTTPSNTDSSDPAPPNPNDESSTPDEQSSTGSNTASSDSNQKPIDEAPPVPDPLPETQPSYPLLLADAQELYDKPEFTIRRRRNNGETLLDRAKRYYGQQAWTKALATLDSIGTNDMRAQRIRGHVHFQQEDYPAAERAFQTILDSNDGAVIQEVEAYYLLSLMAQDKYQGDFFQELLEVVAADSGHPGQKTAKGIQEALQRIE